MKEPCLPKAGFWQAFLRARVRRLYVGPTVCAFCRWHEATRLEFRRERPGLTAGTSVAGMQA
jgi:hypothetical protein